MKGSWGIEEPPGLGVVKTEWDTTKPAQFTVQAFATSYVEHTEIAAFRP